MKKLICLLLMIFLLAGCGAKNEEEPVEEGPEPIAYSESIYVYTDPKSGINSVDDLTDKKIALQSEFDTEYMDYVKNQLIEAGLTEDNFVTTDTYVNVAFMAWNKEIDAWVAPSDRNEMIQDFLNSYEAKNMKTVAEYKMPIYEEEVLPASITGDDLYSKPFAVMLNGIDENIDPHSNPGKARNDVNLLMVVNPAKKHVLTISFPRDSFIYSVKGGYQDKLTHLSFYYGPEDVKNSIGNLLDVEVPYYAQLSFMTFTKMIDGLGGVYVDVPLDMTMDQDSHRDVSQPYSLEKGYEKLYGEWALALARNRKYGVYNGDYGRIRNQALIVNSIINKIANNPFIMDWVGVSWFFDYITDNNFTDKQLEVLCEVAKTFYDGYTIDNYFIENVGSMTESGMSIGLCTDRSIAIASGKIKLVMGEEISSENPYYDDIMTGYVTGGAGSYEVGYIGEEYDLKTIFD